MSNVTLFEEEIYSPEFLSKLLYFQDLRKVVILLSSVFGSTKLDDARSHLGPLRNELLKLAAENKYPPEYKGDHTKTEEIDYIIEHIEKAIDRLEDKYYPDITD